jgi:hypothetical protein
MSTFLSRKGYLKNFFILFSIILTTSCAYMKMNPPPDADKPCANDNSVACDDSCYLATAANMLAGAGYGNGNTVQARAEDIYSDLIIEYNPKPNGPGGWTDTALTWWLSSNNNTWPKNPYRSVTVIGNKNKPPTPWTDKSGAKEIGNNFRECNFVGLSISWPPDDKYKVPHHGHAITAWGDNFGNATPLDLNPTEVRLVDSDTDAGGDVQVYKYDDYTNPNPSGKNWGNGWYFDYSPNHPFIKHIVILSPVDNPIGKEPIQKMFGSYKIHQENEVEATDLHYEAATNVEILSYRTWLSWEAERAPTITEADPRQSITVDWDLSEKPVPFCKWITINTEFILPRWNAISYSDVHFTYPQEKVLPIATVEWSMDTPKIRNASKIPNVTGGYVVGSFDIIDPEKATSKHLVGQYRFVHQYSFDQSPESHVVSFIGTKGYLLANLRFGHLYGYPDEQTLWEFSDWLTDFSEKTYELNDKPVRVELNWEGKLPYPEGEIVPWAKDPSLRKLYQK